LFKQDVAKRMRARDRRLQAPGSAGALPLPRVLADQLNSSTIAFRWAPN